mmetsp:Transcript_28324/g.41845  ORF Transcript_28324/g.41845 Transcript_28324/m.41845 type:complete len:313 (+) Transcript_28324:117-1055(+)|eukprot:CAMPEP_0194214046 /NCGR_PEP_ID=MMETSP0156-20130528/15070_1 /TAXON_ID=33649 /ORGANISM="Thalassionema nitzschioides, Strain L26-B" /LENGTH=312 /DNA_ID=CAMNT_0038942225 /DNA_START=103 /DNA_END=1041 /DNA_ORIENTATION=-
MRALKQLIVLLLMQLSFMLCVESQESNLIEDRQENTDDTSDVIEDLDLDLIDESTGSAGNDETPQMDLEETKNNVSEEEVSNVSEEDTSLDNKDQTSTPGETKKPQQEGPLIDLLGPSLLSLKMVDESHAQLELQDTTDALRGKSVIGLYFSADWCGPCRQFTPELVQFYKKMNSRRGKKDTFEIVWVSQCRDLESFGQYFTHMNWLALPPEEAMGQRGQMLSEKYKVKGIPHLALLDEMGNIITLDARNQIPKDKAGIGFPWRNPIASLYVSILPKSLRTILKAQIEVLKDSVKSKIKMLLPFMTKSKQAA